MYKSGTRSFFKSHEWQFADCRIFHYLFYMIICKDVKKFPYITTAEKLTYIILDVKINFYSCFFFKKLKYRYLSKLEILKKWFYIILYSSSKKTSGKKYIYSFIIGFSGFWFQNCINLKQTVTNCTHYNIYIIMSFFLWIYLIEYLL